MKAANEKRLIAYREFSIRLTANFSPETIVVRRQGNDISKVFQDKNCQPKILYQQNYPPEMKEKQDITTLKNQKPKNREFVASKPVLLEILKGLVQAEMKEHQIKP